VGYVRVSRIIRARVGYSTGVITAAAGVGTVFGAGWALIVGGAAMAASFLLLYDIDEKQP
jgi:hypothetical protein